MEIIESKYLDYCKLCRIVGVSPRTGDQAKQPNQLYFMKTNIIQVVTMIFATAFVAGVGGTKVTGDYLTGIAIAVSYLTVAAVVAMAAADYRGSQRAYFA